MAALALHPRSRPQTTLKKLLLVDSVARTEHRKRQQAGTTTLLHMDF